MQTDDEKVVYSSNESYESKGEGKSVDPYYTRNEMKPRKMGEKMSGGYKIILVPSQLN